jgi:SAM-dependent methyltransferase
MVKTNVDLYDSFYASVYDELVYSPVKTEFEIGHIISSTQPTDHSVIMDVGCGTGHRSHELMTLGYKNVIGIDNSTEMVKRSSSKYPQCTYYVADIMNLSGVPFTLSTYTHIMCMYFTVYYMHDKGKFFMNCYKLLKPGGYLVVHLVDRNQFDPILPPGNPFILINPQGYTKERITKTRIQFNGFDYVANFNLDKPSNVAMFEETFKDVRTNNMRIHKHTLYMNPINEILAIAKTVGYIIQERIDMAQCGYEYQYLYVLYKPA